MRTNYTLVIAMSVGIIFMTLIISLYSPSQKINFGFSGAEAIPRIDWEYLRLRDPKTGEIPKNIRKAELEFAKNLPGSYYNLKYNRSSILGSNWQKRGPYEIGGRTRALAIDVTDESIIIAAGVSSGIWRSSDAGSSWTKMTKPDQLKSISCIVQDTRPGKEHIWYAGTGEFWGNSARISGDGIYKSTDSGKIWNLIPSTSTQRPGTWDNSFDYVWNIVINPAAPLDIDEVYVATTSGAIIRSTNGGDSWQPVLGGYGNNHSYFTDIAITSTGVLYATMSQRAYQATGSVIKGIYRSTNGINWVNISPSFLPELFNRIVIAIAPSDENQVYFIGDTPESGKETTNSRGDRLWHSFWKYQYLSGDGKDDGGLWINRSNYLPSPERVRGQMNSQGSYNLVMKVHPLDTNVIFLGGVNFYRSDDGFSSDDFAWIGGTCPDPDEECWYHYRYPNHHADLHAICFLPSNPNILFTGSDGGVHKTLNSFAPRVVWISLNNGFYTTQFYTVAIDNATEGSIEIIGGTQDNGTLYTYSENIMTPWTHPSMGDGLSCKIADGANVYYTSQNTSTSPVDVKMWRILLDENGQNIVKTRIDPAGGIGFIWNHYFGLDPNDNRRMYVGGGKIIWRNNNLDEIPFVESNDSSSINWDSLSNTRIDPSNPIVNRDGVITAGDISRNPANVLYYGTSQGEIFRIDNAHIGNPTPINITGSNFPTMAWVSCIVIDPDDAYNVIVSFSNYNVISIFQSLDGGLNWTPIAGNLEENPNGSGSGPAINWVEILPVGDKRIYFAGTSTGLYSTSYLNGIYTVWMQEGTETIGNTVVKMIDARSSDGFTAVATHGLGIYSANIKSLQPPPDAPNLIYPNNAQGGVKDTSTFVWSYVDGASFYKLEIASDPEFNSVIHTSVGLRNNQYFWHDIPQGRKSLFWRVSAFSAGGQSSFKETRNFVSAIQAPELIAPLSGSSNQEFNIELQWSDLPDAISYRLQFSAQIVFSEPMIDTVTNADSFFATALLSNQRYNWRVAAIDEYGQGLFSTAFNFRTKTAVSTPEAYFETGLTQIKSVNPEPVASNGELIFYLEKSGIVNIDILDLNGNNRANLLNSYRVRGLNRIYFNVGSLPPGLYMCVLESNRMRHSKKFIILR